ncbi:hypothetical protein I6A84_03370 [Frankia sp. CNm7]|uniref:Uncharacterized protein n=1 Tax=Frankia nepalensis TaxID=1836974 RepID=A0A937RQ02_9ACTN|nr:hypothetical protein [Frankia nepalensis]MBL7498605.1 hypothetical protein [Frankia nepalensis]MBL7510474.1 hypothetical protein [Frankia nepalensis]MBL7517186.1 hypothetical protein [Frankia nepalensis]MBL7630518.1 hypothetical protein [Frankia nepalensis]
MSDLLNGTICAGVRLGVATLRDNQRVAVGYGVNARDWDVPAGIPITRGRAVRCYLGLSYQLVPDDAHRYLMVESSMLGIFLGPDLDECLFHYDYERNKPDGYPEAHLQVEAASDSWRKLLSSASGAKDELAKLHLPVGGRRFRPTVEDIVEFLIVENLADAHPGWHGRVEASRNSFQALQLRAAIRRNQPVACGILRELGYKLQEPSPN